MRICGLSAGCAQRACANVPRRFWRASATISPAGRDDWPASSRRTWPYTSRVIEGAWLSWSATSTTERPSAIKSEANESRRSPPPRPFVIPKADWEAERIEREAAKRETVFELRPVGTSLASTSCLCRASTPVEPRGVSRLVHCESHRERGSDVCSRARSDSDRLAVRPSSEGRAVTSLRAVDPVRRTEVLDLGAVARAGQ